MSNGQRIIDGLKDAVAHARGEPSGTIESDPKTWLERQLEEASREVASWPEWKRDLLRKLTR